MLQSLTLAYQVAARSEPCTAQLLATCRMLPCRLQQQLLQQPTSAAQLLQPAEGADGSAPHQGASSQQGSTVHEASSLGTDAAASSQLSPFTFQPTSYCRGSWLPCKSDGAVNSCSAAHGALTHSPAAVTCACLSQGQACVASKPARTTLQLWQAFHQMHRNAQLALEPQGYTSHRPSPSFMQPLSHPLPGCTAPIPPKAWHRQGQGRLYSQDHRQGQQRLNGQDHQQGQRRFHSQGHGQEQQRHRRQWQHSKQQQQQTQVLQKPKSRPFAIAQGSGVQRAADAAATSAHVEGLLLQASQLLQQGPAGQGDAAGRKQHPQKLTSHSGLRLNTSDGSQSDWETVLRELEETHTGLLGNQSDLILRFIQSAPLSLFIVQPTDKLWLGAAVHHWPLAARRAAALLIRHHVAGLQRISRLPPTLQTLSKAMALYLRSVCVLQAALGPQLAAMLLGPQLLSVMASVADKASEAHAAAANDIQEVRRQVLESRQLLAAQQRQWEEQLVLLPGVGRAQHKNGFSRDAAAFDPVQPVRDVQGVDLGSNVLLRMAQTLQQLPPLAVSAKVVRNSLSAERWEVTPAGSNNLNTEQRQQQAAALVRQLLTARFCPLDEQFDSAVAAAFRALVHALGETQAALVLSSDFLAVAVALDVPRARAVSAAASAATSNRLAYLSHGPSGERQPQYRHKEQNLGLSDALRGVSRLYCPSPEGQRWAVRSSDPSHSVPERKSLAASKGKADASSTSATRPACTAGPDDVLQELAAAGIPAWMPALGVPVAYMMSKQGRPEAWARLHEKQAAMTAFLWSQPEAQHCLQKLLRMRPMGGTVSTLPGAMAWLEHGWSAEDVVGLAVAARHLQGCTLQESGVWTCVLGNQSSAKSAHGRAAHDQKCNCVSAVLREVEEKAALMLPEFTLDQLVRLMAALQRPKPHLSKAMMSRFLGAAAEMTLQLLAPLALTLCYPDAVLLSTLTSRTAPLLRASDVPSDFRAPSQHALNVANIRVALACTASHLYIQQLSAVTDADLSMPSAAAGGGAEAALAALQPQEPVLLQVVLNRISQQNRDEQAADLSALGKLLQDVAGDLPFKASLELLSALAKLNNSTPSTSGRLQPRHSTWKELLASPHQQMAMAILPHVLEQTQRFFIKNDGKPKRFLGGMLAETCEQADLGNENLKGGLLRPLAETCKQADPEYRANPDAMLVDVSAGLASLSLMPNPNPVRYSNTVLKTVFEYAKQEAARLPPHQLGACLISLSLSRSLNESLLVQLRGALRRRLGECQAEEAIQLLATMQQAGAVQQGAPLSAGGGSRLSLATGIIYPPLLQAAAQLVSAHVTQLTPEQAATALVSLAALGFSRATVSPSRQQAWPRSESLPPAPVPVEDVYSRLCDQLMSPLSPAGAQVDACGGPGSNDGAAGGAACDGQSAAVVGRDGLDLPPYRVLEVVEALVRVGLGDHIVIEAAANTLAADLEAQLLSMNSEAVQ